MSLILYQHPLASFCHKVLIALYENDTPFEARMVDLSDPASHAELSSLWPVGKMPVLRDLALESTIPETSIIIEYLDRHYRGKTPLLPEDLATSLRVRLWDRFFDLYVQTPMQKIVADMLRTEESRDPAGVADAKQALVTAYGMIEKQLGENDWITGNAFTMADCSAAPALFYAETLVAFGEAHEKLKAYFQRLLQRSSFARVLREAGPYFKFYPYANQLRPEFRVTATD